MLQDSTQTTGTPNSGASNAQDFQPTTRNPQVPVNPLQQQSGLQESTDAQQVLGAQQNAQITVPVNPARGPRPASPEPVNQSPVGLLLIILAAVVIVALAHFVRKRGKVQIFPEEEDLANTEPESTTEQTIVAPKKPPVKATKRSKKKRRR